MSLISTYFSPEFVFSVPFLILVGRAIKKSKRIDDSLIPAILTVSGILTSAIITLASNTPETIFQWLTFFITCLGQGWLAGLSAVGAHQLFKQSKMFRQFSDFDGGIKDKGNESAKTTAQRARKKAATTAKKTTITTKKSTATTKPKATTAKKTATTKKDKKTDVSRETF